MTTSPYPPKRRPRLPMILLAAGAVLVITLSIIVIIAVGSDRAPRPAPAGIPSPAVASANPAPTASADPYETYLKLAPKGSQRLSREDAQARAWLGCGQSWAPGTVDAALAVAYKDLCKRGG